MISSLSSLIWYIFSIWIKFEFEYKCWLYAYFFLFFTVSSLLHTKWAQHSISFKLKLNWTLTRLSDMNFKYAKSYVGMCLWVFQYAVYGTWVHVMRCMRYSYSISFQLNQSHSQHTTNKVPGSKLLLFLFHNFLISFLHFIWRITLISLEHQSLLQLCWLNWSLLGGAVLWCGQYITFNPIIALRFHE